MLGTRGMSWPNIPPTLTPRSTPIYSLLLCYLRHCESPHQTHPAQHQINRAHPSSIKTIGGALILLGHLLYSCYLSDLNPPLSSAIIALPSSIIANNKKDPVEGTLKEVITLIHNIKCYCGLGRVKGI